MKTNADLIEFDKALVNETARAIDMFLVALQNIGNAGFLRQRAEKTDNATERKSLLHKARTAERAFNFGIDEGLGELRMVRDLATDKQRIGSVNEKE